MTRNQRGCFSIGTWYVRRCTWRIAAHTAPRSMAHRQPPGHVVWTSSRRLADDKPCSRNTPRETASLWTRTSSSLQQINVACLLQTVWPNRLTSHSMDTALQQQQLLLHPFNGLFSGTTWVSRYQKGKTSLDFNEARDDGVLGWQWHQLDHMQIICTSLQRDNPHQHIITQFLQAGCSS